MCSSDLDHCVIGVGLKAVVASLAAPQVGNDRATLDGHHCGTLLGEFLFPLGNEIVQHLVHGRVCLAARAG